MGIADERKIDEILEGLNSTLSSHLTRPTHIAAAPE